MGDREKEPGYHFNESGRAFTYAALISTSLLIGIYIGAMLWMEPSKKHESETPDSTKTLSQNSLANECSQSNISLNISQQVNGGEEKQRPQIIPKPVRKKISIPPKIECIQEAQSQPSEGVIK